MGGGKILYENTSKYDKVLTIYLGKSTTESTEVENLGILWYTITKHGSQRGRTGNGAAEPHLKKRFMAAQKASLARGGYAAEPRSKTSPSCLRQSTSPCQGRL
jgi:hypothetical protein